MISVKCTRASTYDLLHYTKLNQIIAIIIITTKF